MDNVSSIEFEYKIIRQPKQQSKNIFEYAASLIILEKNDIFLQIEDICIIDLIHKLSSYNLNIDVFEFIPIDSVDKVLIIKTINSKYAKMMSDWSSKIIIVNKRDLINAIKLLKMNFECETKIKIEKYYKD